jgi:hypothetical protein
MSSVNGSNAAYGLHLASSSRFEDDDSADALNTADKRAANAPASLQDEQATSAAGTEQAAQKLAQDMLALMAALMAALQSAPASPTVQAAAKAVLTDVAGASGTNVQQLTPAEHRTIADLAESGNLSLDQLGSAYDTITRSALAPTGPVTGANAAGNDLPHHAAGKVDMKAYM